MLTLTRRKGQEIVLTDPAGRRIVVRLIEVRGRYAKLAIKAPRDVTILRAELVGRKPRAPNP